MLLDSLIDRSPQLVAIATHLQQRVAPIATRLDHDADALRSALKDLGQHRWLGLCLDTAYGGAAFSSRDYFLATALLARHSGALAFLQTQHQSAGRFIATGTNPALQATYLPRLVTGEALVGIGFSHLRRPVPPLQAQPVADGYRLSGEVPWVTGDQMFSEFVGAATLPSGEALLGLLPLTDQSTFDGHIRISPPMALAALGSTRTVRVSFDHWWLPHDRVVDRKPADWIHHRDRQGVLKAASFAIGSAQAALDVMHASLECKGWSSLRPAASRLQQSLDRCLQQCLEALPNPATRDAVVQQKRQLRARAIALAGRCAQAAIATCGGAANSQHHPAQRIYREVLVFTVSGQTPELAAAIVEELESRP